MSPEVTAAIIAASVSVLTLIGTLAAQYFGRRATSRDTEETLREQRKQEREHLDKTFAEQREQLDKTLAEQRTRTLNERFATAAEQLGSDKQAVRLAGVYAMAGLADDWEKNRQTCVDVLCAYLRMPYEPEPGQDAPEPQRLAFQAIREVRHTVIRVITAHLKEDAAVSWQGLNLDFTGVVFDGADFNSAQFSGGTVKFCGAQFHRGTVDFDYAQFSGGTVDFNHAQFSGAEVVFNLAQFSGGTVRFGFAQFSGGTVMFAGASFSGGTVYFNHAQFSAAEIRFSFAQFSGGTVMFAGARFSGGTVKFDDAQFSGGAIHFGGPVLNAMGLGVAEFSGGEVDFSDAGDWSFPPVFPWTDMPPSAVKLPGKDDQSEV